MGLRELSPVLCFYNPATPPTLRIQQHMYMAIAKRGARIWRTPDLFVLSAFVVISSTSEFLEHGMGFEPMNNGFAGRRVSHFATRAHKTQNPLLWQWATET